ncbi:ubiquitin carboxyl-terminal hydrolase 35-like isoform X2 [Ctenocephalides felis]|uniref:ubiquitin carboxyl-terminal hydrolase 35-like isoform X2 n=1 Tax=Ctenocephalides felis TaxID=7515 RepID=UPI000E6E14F4|nr:ubiquitin carboxyl-terminal hydrolase 35-like isoform X2 [Ctenocephalides felis]
MAVKQHVNEVDERSEVQPVDLEQIIQTIKLIRQNRSHLLVGSNLVNLFETIVHCLAHVHNPRETGLSRFLENVNLVRDFFKETCDNLPNTLKEQVVSACLKKLYLVLSKADSSEPCAAVSIILTLVEPNIVPGAVSWLLRENPGDDETLLRILRRLFMWLRYCNYTPCLTEWTITFMKGLQEEGRWDVMLAASSLVIENLLAGLAMPLFRSTIAPVVEHMLTTVLHTPLLLQKVLPRLMVVLNQLSREDSISANLTRQRLIDIITALLEVFPNEIEGHKDVVNFVHNVGPSADYRRVLKCNASMSIVRMSTPGSSKVGLNNLGNTCYMNSVLQSLFMTRQFYKQVILSSGGKRGIVMKQLAHLFALLSYSNRPYISPKDILQIARPPGFTPGQYHDSSEFLVYLLDTLHEQETQLNRTLGTEAKVANTDDVNFQSNSDMFTKSKLPGTSKNSNEYMETDDKFSSDKIILKSSSSNIEIDMDSSSSSNPYTSKPDKPLFNTDCKTITQTCFNGEMLTCYECMACRSRSNNHDTFRDLQLAFPDNNTTSGEKSYSVQWLLDYYLSKEKLQGANKYSCGQCKTLCDAERSITILGAPQNLILTLKHFRYDAVQHERKKLSHKIHHNEKVHLVVMSNKQPVKVFYMLYAAVVHDGVNMDSGHYYTYAMDKHKHWYKFNDSVVSNASFKDLDEMNPYNTPYILFYKIIGTQSISAQELKQNGVDSPKKLRLGETMIYNGLKNKDKDMFNMKHCSEDCDIDFEDLPLDLQDLIRRDNKRFEEENLFNKSSNTNTSLLFGKDKSDSDNEDDSPSGCSGGSGITSNANRYIF